MEGTFVPAVEVIAAFTTADFQRLPSKGSLIESCARLPSLFFRICAASLRARVQCVEACGSKRVAPGVLLAQVQLSIGCHAMKLCMLCSQKE